MSKVSQQEFYTTYTYACKLLFLNTFANKEECQKSC